MKKAFIHFAEGFEEIEGLTIVDVLRRAEIPTFMVSVTGKKEVTGAHGIKIVTDLIFEEVNYNEAAIVILPGGLPGAKNLQDHEGLCNIIKEKAEAKEPLAAICAAPMVFGGLGILDGKDAVCYPGFEDQLKGADIKDTLAVKSENIITGKGPGASLNFALEIVVMLKGEEKAQAIAQGMIVKTWN